RHAADSATRRELLHIYSSLGNRSAYNDEVNLRMRFGKCAMPCTMRLSDISILGEIPFDDQYKSPADYTKNCGLTRIDLLKLDIEGAELDALIGLGDRIADVSVIVGEVHEAMVDSDAIYEHLASNSFDIVWKKYFQEGPVSQVHNFEARRRGRA
ncbi:MAG: FkbM family methyltransferase, partial [Silicimonas sp.]|nr:FkbM family methyltransferase [Silicimonas sp.]